MKTLYKFSEIELLPVALNLFDASAPDPNTQTTGSSDLSPEMKTYYDKELIELTEAELIHDQFGQQKDIPAGSGKTIEFRQFDPLPELTTPLTEGVTPDGQSMKVRSMTATVSQYGGYVTVSDLLDMTAVDPMILEATKLISSQAGRTLDTITREVINAGTNVQYARGKTSGTANVSAPTTRFGLGYTDGGTNHNISVDDIKRAVRTLKNQDAKEIDGSFVGILHPDVAYDLMRDPEWLAPKEYVDTDGIYNGEIGKLYGVRFVENTRAKVFTAAPLTAGSKILTVKTAIESSTTTVAVKEAITSADATALAGRKVWLGTKEVTIASASAAAAGSATLTLSAAETSVAANTVISPQGAGAAGADVYSTLIIADDAYGVTKLANGGLQHIVKQRGSAGTADPLNQRGTVGWKATKTAEILVQQYMVRIESTASP